MMGLFRRRPKAEAGAGQAEGSDAHAAVPPAVSGRRTVHERIEVTVEREWVSMVVRNPGPASRVEGATVEGRVSTEDGASAEAEVSELPKGD